MTEWELKSVVCMQIHAMFGFERLCINFSFAQVNAVTGSLFTSEVLQSVAQEVEQEVTKSDVPAGDHVGVTQCYSVSCCVNIAPPTLRTLRTLTMSLSTTGAVVSRTKMIQRSTSPQSMATSFSPQPLMGGALGKLHIASSN